MVHTLTTCWKDTHPQASHLSTAEWSILMDFDGGSLCAESRRVDDVWAGPDIYCADLAQRVPWCVAYRAQWRHSTEYTTGPLMTVKWVPEADGLVAGLVVLALLSRVLPNPAKPG